MLRSKQRHDRIVCTRNILGAGLVAVCLGLPNQANQARAGEDMDRFMRILELGLGSQQDEAARKGDVKGYYDAQRAIRASQATRLINETLEDDDEDTQQKKQSSRQYSKKETREPWYANPFVAYYQESDNIPGISLEDLSQRLKLKQDETWFEPRIDRPVVIGGFVYNNSEYHLDVTYKLWVRTKRSFTGNNDTYTKIFSGKQKIPPGHYAFVGQIHEAGTLKPDWHHAKFYVRTTEGDELFKDFWLSPRKKGLFEK